MQWCSVPMEPRSRHRWRLMRPSWPRSHAQTLSDTRSSGALTEPLAAWAERGALFIVPTSYAAAALRALLGLAPERVRVVPVPLPPARIPPACSDGGEDVLAIYPTAYSWVLTAVSLLRIVGLEPRLLLAGPGADALVRPAGAVGSYGLLAGREVLAVSDWREAVPSAGAIVLSGSDCGMGSTLREALATGRPVVAGATPWVTEHLATIGAGAYMYEDSRTLVSALLSALRRDRGEALERAAREAVLSERWESSARALFTTLLDAIGHPPSIQLSEPPEHASIPASEPAVKVVSEPLRVCVLNPNSSGGGGERFMRQLVLAMASHTFTASAEACLPGQARGRIRCGNSSARSTAVCRRESSRSPISPWPFPRRQRTAMSSTTRGRTSLPHLRCRCR